MNKETERQLSVFHKTLDECEIYGHALAVMQFDMETICPEQAVEQEGETIAALSNKVFRLQRKQSFLKAMEYLYGRQDELVEQDALAVRLYYERYLKEKNITPAMDHKFSRIFNKSFADWQKARAASDFSIFAPSLGNVIDAERKIISLRDEKKDTPYDSLLDDYEKGMTTARLDELFGACREFMVPFLEKIRNSGKQIRTDFLSRPVSDEAQGKMTRYLLDVLGFDMTRGTFALTEHPFTSHLARLDTRVTTHYYPTMFLSSMYSVIHECGHALFDQNQRADNAQFHIDNKTMGQHESVSRLYENIFGRSKSFVHLIYDMTCEIFPEAMAGVSENELYEAVNFVQPSLIRTEADEFTYVLHIIIRYELEKKIIGGSVRVQDLPGMWADCYEEYLGVRPQNDREGILQDVHWTSMFGYFPTYALGNMYNAMYYGQMQKELDVDSLIRNGDFAAINGWMQKNVFECADALDPADWILRITGRELCPDDFLRYLENKYGELYGL